MPGNKKTGKNRGVISVIRSRLSPHDNGKDNNLKSSSLPSSPVDRSDTLEDKTDNNFTSSCPIVFNSLYSTVSPSTIHSSSNISLILLHSELDQNTMAMNEWQLDVIKTLVEVDAIDSQLKPIRDTFSVEIFDVRTTPHLQAFNKHVVLCQNRFFTSASMESDSSSNSRKDALQRLEKNEGIVPHSLGNRVKVIRAWYAASFQRVKIIVENGFDKIENSEEGLFGKGIYFSTSPKYALELAKNCSEPCLLMCYVIVLNPFPVLLADLEPDNKFKLWQKAYYRDFDCLFIPVTFDSKMQVTPVSVQESITEILVVFQESNVLIQAQFILKPKPIIAPPNPTVPEPLQQRVKLAYQIPSKEIKRIRIIHESSEYTLILAEWHTMYVVVKQFNEIPLERATFIRELTAWKESAHPFCVSMLGIIDEEDLFGFVSEYCQNGSLKNIFASDVKIGGIQAVEIAQNIAAALTTLHVKSIAHRNIKSSNILLDSNYKAKLGDFGYSRMLNSTPGATAGVGSFTHMAPEHIYSKGKIDPFPADVYSFGIFMHELATNKELHQRNPPPDMSTPHYLAEEYRQCWWGIAQKCTTVDPNERPKMSEILSMLSELAVKISNARSTESLSTTSLSAIVSIQIRLDYAIALKEALENIERDSNIPIKVFLDSECLPSAEDWEKSFLHGLHKSKVLVPIISGPGWERMKQASISVDNVLKEYENMIDRVSISSAKILPWIIGGTPRTSDYPNDPHISSGRPIRSTLDSIMKYQGIKKTPEEVIDVATIIAKKLDDNLSGSNSLVPPPAMTFSRRRLIESDDEAEEEEKKEERDIGIMIEGTDTPHMLVNINIHSLISELRKNLVADGEINFTFKFIARTVVGAPLTSILESKKKIVELLDNNGCVLIRRINQV